MKKSNFMAIVAGLLAWGAPPAEAHHRARIWSAQTNGEFHPRRHTVMSYSAQNRQAKKRRNRSPYRKGK